MDGIAAMGTVQLDEVAMLPAKIIGCVVIPLQTDGLIAAAKTNLSKKNAPDSLPKDEKSGAIIFQI